MPAEFPGRQSFIALRADPPPDRSLRLRRPTPSSGGGTGSELDVRCPKPNDARSLRERASFRTRSVLRRAALLVVVDLLEIGVDHLVVRLAAGRGTAARPAAALARTAWAGLAGALLRLVHRLAELHRELAERLG